MKYIFTYDIENDKRRNKISKIISKYGIRIQFSVFECKLDKNELKYLINEIEELIKKGKDSVFIFPLCDNCNNKTIFMEATLTERRISFIEV